MILKATKLKELMSILGRVGISVLYGQTIHNIEMIKKIRRPMAKIQWFRYREKDSVEVRNDSVKKFQHKKIPFPLWEPSVGGYGLPFLLGMLYILVIHNLEVEKKAKIVLTEWSNFSSHIYRSYCNRYIDEMVLQI
ncbi:MAG: hypothetical protein CM15mV143_290 [Caudoviricetes sp.]|nr:MAG: hypothetical protein CM15mV143_290 [Caudoviricetes sp.]